MGTLSHAIPIFEKLAIDFFLNFANTLVDLQYTHCIFRHGLFPDQIELNITVSLLFFNRSDYLDYKCKTLQLKCLVILYTQTYS